MASPARWPKEDEGAQLKLTNGAAELVVQGRVTLLPGCAVADFPLPSAKDALQPFLLSHANTSCRVSWTCEEGVFTLFSSSPYYDVGWKVLAHSAEHATEGGAAPPQATLLAAPPAPACFRLRLKAIASFGA